MRRPGLKFFDRNAQQRNVELADRIPIQRIISSPVFRDSIQRVLRGPQRLPVRQQSGLAVHHRGPHLFAGQLRIGKQRSVFFRRDLVPRSQMRRQCFEIGSANPASDEFLQFDVDLLISETRSGQGASPPHKRSQPVNALHQLRMAALDGDEVERFPTLMEVPQRFEDILRNW